MSFHFTKEGSFDKKKAGVKVGGYEGCAEVGDEGNDVRFD